MVLKLVFVSPELSHLNTACESRLLSNWNGGDESVPQFCKEAAWGQRVTFRGAVCPHKEAMQRGFLPCFCWMLQGTSLQAQNSKKSERSFIVNCFAL